jgi:hypothetical protein
VSPRVFIPAGRELIIGHPDGGATIVTSPSTHGTWTNVPIGCPTLEREARELSRPEDLP